MRSIVAYNEEHTYDGEYEQVQDYEHKNRPVGHGWYLIKSGWARGGEHSLDRSPVVSKVVPTRDLCECLRNISDIDEYVGKDISYLYSASDAVHSQLGNVRDKCRWIDDLIVDFADKKMSSAGNLLSGYLGYLYHLSPDFRNEGRTIPLYDEKILNMLDEYIRSEQGIIRASGIVNENDTVTLFRNTDDRQLGKVNPLGFGYVGNNIESWTTNPNMEVSFAKPGRKKIMAHVPLRACVASCIGRRERPFMFVDEHECEIMVCGAYIDRIQIVGTGRDTNVLGLKESYLGNIQVNICRYVSSVSFANKEASLKMARTLLGVARELIEGV